MILKISSLLQSTRTPLLAACCRGIAVLGMMILCISATADDNDQFRRTVAYTVSNGGRSVQQKAYLAEEVDVQPSYPGGDQALVAFINKERKYPQEAYNNGIEGRVLCSFIVKPDGQLTNIEVIKGVERSLNVEAVRVIEEMPRWNPGKIDDEPVAVFQYLAIPFRR